MKHHPTLAPWFTTLTDSFAASTLVKLSLTKPTPAADDLKSIDIRPLMVKRELKLSFTYHHKTRDIVKNYGLEESLQLLGTLLGKTFTTGRLCTLEGDYHVAQHGGGFVITRHPASTTQAPELAHNRAKQHVLSATNKPYLHALGLTNAQGIVLPAAQDKFKQINKYIEILDGLIKQLPPQPSLSIVDMGSGKGYLTFALYDHLTSTLKLKANVVGVETRPDMVKLCNHLATQVGFDGLRFVEGTIASHACTGVDVVIALHACDTATDDALAKAVLANAKLIVVAPCCHKQIRRAMAPVAENHPLHAFLQYGTYIERMAEMATDGLRATLLQLHGYITNVFEFIGGEHTPKNVMIVATRRASALKPAEASKLSASLTAAKTQLGIASHYLETLLQR